MNNWSVGIPTVSIRHLKSMLCVARYGNLTKASIELNRSQTAVTKAINDLETQLSVKLFERSSRGMQLTVYGQALFNRLVRAESEFSKAGIAYRDQTRNTKNFEKIPIFSMDISYKRLASLIALFEAKNVANAAEILEITSHAVYNSIREIESVLEVSLFERIHSGVSPTALCVLLVRHIKLAFSQIRHALDDIASLSGITTGSIALGTLPYTRTLLTPRAINNLLEKYPQIDVSTTESNYNLLEASLRSGDIDFIIGAIREEKDEQVLKTETLFVDRLSLIVRKDHPLINEGPLSFADIIKYDWILPPVTTPARKLFNAELSAQNAKLEGKIITTSSLSIVRGLLLESNRVALLSEHQIHYEKEHGLLNVLSIQLKNTYRAIGVTMRANTEPSPAAALFLTSLREVVFKLMEEDINLKPHN